LEQEFNSLDAQREACAAYIASQRHEGWILAPELYDDGGYSGGNMNRPGLSALMADVRAGQIDVIVVYKVDRLTRSLADFAKIVEVLDAQGASFVSVTQSFNTTTSMGRLTLNVLLSFAQFEREVTGERIRDKIAASKKKGMWMGGPVPLGYDVVDRKLVINPAEAQTVQHIFETYNALGSVTSTVDALATQGIVTKVTRTSAGGTRGGVAFARGSLAHLLSNRVYLGEMRHRDAHYPGEHSAIIAPELWNSVATNLADRRVKRRSERNLRHGNALGGLLFDSFGRPMQTCSASKGSRTYHYYASRADQVSGDAQPSWRMPAHDLETTVTEAVRKLLGDASRVHDAVAGLALDQNTLADVLTLARARAAEFEISNCRDLVERVTVHNNQVEILVRIAAIIPPVLTATRPSSVKLSVPTVRMRRGKEVRLLIPGNDAGVHSNADPALLKLLANAFAARDAVTSAAAGQALKDIAASEGYSLDYFSLLLRLSMLAPDIVGAIYAGRQPPSLNRQRLARTTKLPIDWSAQRVALGFA
jgi:DNA invertase Pin-like site-specific DNA recombinase